MNIYNIIEGWLNRFRTIPPAQKALFDDRFKICQSNECGKLKLGICTACGCPVKAKTKSLNEECPENMWNPVLREYEGKEFFFVEELPMILQSEFISWLVYKSDTVGFKLDGEWAYNWQEWKEFKKYLRENNA